MVESRRDLNVNPDESSGPKQEKIKKKKLKTTGGRSKGVRPSTTPSCNITKVLIVIVTILILIAAAIAVVLLIVVDQASSSKRYFEKMSCDEEEPTPMHINSCLNSKCIFDLSTCVEPCPFGYRTDESGCEDSCECAVEGTYEGDIAFAEDDLPELTQLYGYAIPDQDFAVFAGSSTSGTIWDGNMVKGRHKIYYDMASTVPEKAKKAINVAIKRYKEKTCIDFIERKHEKQYFRFTSRRGCASMVGRHRRNGQQVSIGRGCEVPGVVQHELLHLLGFHHEHSRPDRDSYLKVIEDNIVKERLGNFKKRLKSQVRDLDSEYDLMSVLHYPSNAFSKNKKATILTRTGGNVIKAQRRGFTNEDLYEVNSLYKCYEQLGDAAKWTVWTQWSSCDETCGFGERSRFRKCQNKKEEIVEGCKGSKFQRIACQAPQCPKLAGSWSEWGTFTECSVQCNGGFQWRRRQCTPYGQCEGVSYQGKACNLQACEGMPLWAEWSRWSYCSKTCGGGEMTRKRQCMTADLVPALTCEGDDATGIETQERHCKTRDCGGPSSESDYESLWSSCSSSCDGTRIRDRICEFTCPPGQEFETEACNIGLCVTSGADIFVGDVVDMPQILCNPKSTSKWYFGDFNGDGRTDALCATLEGEFFKLAHSNPEGSPVEVNWQGYLTGCTGWERFIGDFNGDGRDDIICRDARNRKLTIKLATKQGLFDDLSLNVGDFCTEPRNKLLVSDVNADGKADLVCYTGMVDIEVRLNHGF